MPATSTPMKMMMTGSMSETKVSILALDALVVDVGHFAQHPAEVGRGLADPDHVQGQGGKDVGLGQRFGQAFAVLDAGRQASPSGTRYLLGMAWEAEPDGRSRRAMPASRRRLRVRENSETADSIQTTRPKGILSLASPRARGASRLVSLHPEIDEDENGDQADPDVPVVPDEHGEKPIIMLT